MGGSKKLIDLALTEAEAQDWAKGFWVGLGALAQAPPQTRAWANWNSESPDQRSFNLGVGEPMQAPRGVGATSIPGFPG